MNGELRFVPRGSERLKARTVHLPGDRLPQPQAAALNARK